MMIFKVEIIQIFIVSSKFMRINIKLSHLINFNNFKYFCTGKQISFDDFRFMNNFYNFILSITSLK